MEKQILESLIGRAFLVADQLETVRLTASDNTCIAIYSVHSVRGGPPSQFFGQTHVLSGVTIDESEIKFDFVDGYQLAVDMSDDGYKSPEAMNLISANGDVYIWN